MTNSKINLFTWNDIVIIKSYAPPNYFPGNIAVICGMEKVKSEELSSLYNIEFGNWLYTIEFGDGSSIEIPEKYLEKYQSE
jgi:hypothetical protein